MTLTVAALILEGFAIIRNVYLWRLKEMERMKTIVVECIKLGVVMKEFRDYCVIHPPGVNKINDNVYRSLIYLCATVVFNLDVIDPGEKCLCFCDNIVNKTVRDPVIVVSSCFFNLGGKVMKNFRLHRLLSLFDRLV